MPKTLLASCALVVPLAPALSPPKRNFRPSSSPLNKADDNEFVLLEVKELLDAK